MSKDPDLMSLSAELDVPRDAIIVPVPRRHSAS